MPVTDQAFVTLCTNDIYCQGALVLGKSLRNHGTSRKLVVMITSQVTTRMRGILNSVFDEIIEVDTLDSADSVHLSLLKRPELGITFTKLQCWTLTQYTKCVFMDADTIVLCNIDELFDREEFSAAPDSGWPDCFNSGVFVFRPSIETFGRLLQFAENNGSFDGGDQGLLNSFFSNWSTADISKHLPFIYNLSISNIYTYAPAFKQFGSEAKVIHFIGTPKPWNCKYNPQTQWIVDNESLSGHHNLSFLVLWWEIFISDILPLLAQQEELDKENSQQHQIGRIEIILKNENPSSVCPEATPSENTDSIPPDNVWEQQTLDDSVPAQEIQLPPQPLTQDIVYMGELAHSVSELSIQETEEQPRTEDERQMWEQGHIDYMGKDSFENIQKKLDRFLH